MPKRITIPAIIISIYFIFHGALYITCSLFFNGVWNSIFSFLFGNATLSSIFFLLPIILGILYISAAFGLLFGNHWARILLWLLCVLGIFLEFPLGTIISIAILIYSFVPSFSKVFSSKINKSSFQIGGMVIIVIGIVSFLIVSGVASGFLSFATYSVSGYGLSEDTPESKIVNITQRVGITDVLLELTASTDYAIEQQDALLANIARYIIKVKQRFTEASNGMIVTIEASNLLEIAKDKNIAKIYSLNPSFQFLPDELLIDTSQSYASLQLNVEALWKQGITGKGITVAVMDTGIKEDHPDLQRDGKSIVVGGLHLHGEYVHEHGTMVASCIANQNETYKGIAPDVNLLNIEVFQWQTIGGIRYLTATNADILQGFEFIANWKKITGDFVILSCSWGVSTQSWKHDADICTEAVNRLAMQYNIPVIAAAGNSGPKTMPYTPIPYQIMSPGGAKNVLAVGAVNNNNGIASFSSRGPYYTGIDKPDIVAPGVNVPVLNYQKITTASGTSFACPYVSGVAALLAQDHEGLSVTQLYDAIKRGATDLGETGYDYEYGYGIVNAENSLEYIEQAPSTGNMTYMVLVIMIFGAIIMFYPSLNKKLH
ncbi:MAG: S8 family serine peptidase [Thermoplasmata archaeon]|nr:S8 family serine peptidase [Thermoplasmata archaeon]